MKIELIMRDENGVPGLFRAEGEWLALDPEHVEIVKDFKPVKFNEITIWRDNGNHYRFGPVFGVFGDGE